MKKILIAGLLLIALLSGCGRQTEAPLPEKTTLMLYMIGSDLEAQAGAATKDLQEILDSGVDLSRVNVVVYAGGSPHWHNDNAAPENHTLLWLTDTGFQQVAAVPTSSMGEAGCLSNFLTYAHDNFPADQYALILWDHGDGPVIGYGRDMLFDNDTLTLLEMEQALETTPFAEEKLSWVGFDACLMASAELCGVWADYADYLVASQEVEPSFGWNYSFLSRLGAADTVSVLEDITHSYLESCLTYYENRGYDPKDTTLSCMDLSGMPTLEASINTLFSAAAADSYHTVTARRVQTRALGRATTGSEYDLIDLLDLTAQFADLFPDEAEAVRQALDSMVISNATNAQGCGGLSLYYPFYNKYYFRESWGDTYRKLDMFPQYLRYLQDYESTWLSEDLLEVASSVTPQQTLADTYTLQLTPQQQETFASAKYYILVRDGEEYFTRIFVSPDVSNSNGLLTADFDGNVIYVRDDFGTYQIPVTIAHDTVGEESRYSVFVTFTNYSLSLSQIPQDFETQVVPHRFSLTLDKATNQVSVTSLVPYDHSTDQAVLVGGKLEETDLSQWASCFFLHDDHRYLSHYDNGAVMPVDQWPVSTQFSGYEYPTENGLEFVYAPLASGEYYLLFEVEDTQGNRYCSELLPIGTEGTLPMPEAAAPTDISWTQGETVTLWQNGQIQVRLCKETDSSGQSTYLLEADNRGEIPLRIYGSDLSCGDVFCTDAFCSVKVAPGETARANWGVDLGAAHELGKLSDLTQIQLSLTVQNSLTGAALLYEQPFRVSLSEQTLIGPDTVSAQYNAFQVPTLGILAEEQLLLDTQDARVTLLGLGGSGKDNQLRGALCIENPADQPLNLSPKGLVLDGTYVTVYSNLSQIPAHSKVYCYFNVADNFLTDSGITSARSVRLLLQHDGYSPLFTGNTPTSLYWCDIVLAEAAVPSQFREGEVVLFEENGVRVCLRSKEQTDTKTLWQLTVRNDTQQDICLNLTDLRLDGEAVAPGDSPVHLSYAQLGAGQTCVGELEYYHWEDDPAGEISFRFRVLDFAREAILFTGTDPVNLP